MANILVTGGSGLIGWRCVELLRAQGHEVVVYDLMPNRENLADFLQDITIVQGDVTDLPKLLATMKSNKIDHVIHLAAFITEFARIDPAGAFRINTIGSSNIFDAAKALGVRRVVWTSSITALAVAADYDNRPVGEDHRLITAEPYGASKYATEVVSANYRRIFGQDIIGIRPALTYGLGRLGSGAGIFNNAVRNMALGEAVGLLGSKTLHQPMYNRDMARLLVTALFGPPSPQAVFNTPVAKDYTDAELVSAMKTVCPDADIRVDPIPDYIPKVPVMDGSAARAHFNFSAEYALEDGVAEMVEIFRSRAAA